MAKSCTELLLIFVNAMFLLGGVAGIVCGTLMAVSDLKNPFFIHLDALFDRSSAIIRNIGYSIIAASCLAVIISTIGCIGVCTHQKFPIFIYACLLMFVIVLEFAGIVMVEVFTKVYKERAKKKALDSLGEFSEAINVMQKRLRCCGIDGPRNYDPDGSIIPMSCGSYTKGCNEKMMGVIEEKHDPPERIKEMVEEIQLIFNKLTEQYGKPDHQGYTMRIDLIQEKWKCCGREGASDYENKSVPISCRMYPKGCFEKVKEMNDLKNLEVEYKKRATFKTLLWNFYRNPNFVSFKEDMDSVQKKGECCGIDGPRDYDPTAMVVPKSCSNYAIGCYDKLVEWIDRNKIIWLGATIVLMLFQLGLFICSVYLCRTKPDEYQTIMSFQSNAPGAAQMSYPNMPVTGYTSVAGVSQPSMAGVNQPSMARVNQPGMSRVSQSSKTAVGQPSKTAVGQPSMSRVSHPSPPGMERAPSLARVERSPSAARWSPSGMEGSQGSARWSPSKIEGSPSTARWSPV